MDRSVVLYDYNKIGGELCKRKLSFFVKEFWDVIVPNPLIWNWHMDVLCDEIQESDERVFKRLPKKNDIIFNVPPGTTKTLITSVFSTAWEFARMPSIKVFVGSYSDGAVTGIADNIRLLMKSEKYRAFFPEVIVRSDRDSLHNFKTTENGEFYAFTVGGTITSKHADILKVDDPLNPKQSASAAMLKAVNDFFDNTLPTRKVDKEVTPTYLTMQRLGVNDPTGHLLGKKGESIRHICLPGVLSNQVKPAELQSKYTRVKAVLKNGTQVTGLLDEKRLTLKSLNDLLVDLGSKGFAGQIGQLPAPEGGTVWQQWLIPVPDDQFPIPGIMSEIGTDWDLAYTKEEQNSASAYIKSGVIQENTFIFDLGWQWNEFPEQIKWMKQVGGPHWIENKGPGKSCKQTLKKGGVVAVEVKVQKDKVSRAKDATPTAEAGFIYIKKSLIDRLYNDPKQGILFFPNGEHNDLADALSQMICRRYKKGKIVMSGPSSIPRQFSEAEQSELQEDDPLDWVE